MKVVLVGQYPATEDQPMTGPMRVLVNLKRGLDEVPNLSTEVFYRNEKYPFWIQPFEFIQRLLSIQADIVHLHGTVYGLGWLSLMNRVVHGSKVVFTMHGLAAIERQMGYNYWFLIPICEEILTKKADRVTTVSTWMQHKVAEDYQLAVPNITVIPNGVDNRVFDDIDPSRFFRALNIPASYPIILFAGGTRRVKGLDWLLDALKCCDALPWRLVVAGTPGDQHTQIVDLASHFSASRIVFVGGLDNELLSAAYRAATILVHPSRYEPFGLVPLEGMSAGAAVVVSDRVGMSYLIQDGVSGYVVPYGNTQLLTDRIRLLLTEEQRRIDVGRNAINIAEDCRWGKIVSQYVKLYQEVLTV